jgi:hypothetical protein
MACTACLVVNISSANVCCRNLVICIVVMSQVVTLVSLGAELDSADAGKYKKTLKHAVWQMELPCWIHQFRFEH